MKKLKELNVIFQKYIITCTHFILQDFNLLPRTRDLTQIAIEVEEARLGFRRIAKQPMVLAQEPRVLDEVDITGI